MSLPLVEFARRRETLMGLMQADSVAIIPGASVRLRNRDVAYPFRQDSDFYYLTGLSEADALLVLVPGRAHGEAILFVQDRDARAESYDGERIGPDRAAQLLGVDDAYPINDLADILPGLMEGRERIYMTLGEYPQLDRRILGWVANIRARESGGAQPPGEFVALKHLLHELRLYKSAKELKLMREAARITGLAHERAMRACRPGITELHLEAELLHEFMQHGARSPAYPSIVAAGANACVLHYTDNDSTIRKDNLVLIDAGCEYDHYAADVTRTFPASGKFSATQKRVYEIVLQAQLAAIEQCVPGAHFNAPHDAALAIMVEGLIDLKLLEGSVESVLEDQSYLRFCPHKASHWLGLDVHDVGDYRLDGDWRELEPGMVLTIEPGIYIPDNEANAELPPRFRGLGIRIEDDVLVTQHAPEVLTASVPKTVSEIERTMKSAQRKT